MPVDLNDSYETLYQRAISQMEIGNANQAIELLERIINRLTRLRPETIQQKQRLRTILDATWESLVRFLRWQKQHDRAIAVCKQVSSHVPDSQEPRYQIGSLMIDRGDEQEGLEQIKQTLAEDPSLEGWIILGAEYLNLERYDEAIASYQSALKLATDNESAALANIGLFLTYRAQGCLQDALDTWAMVVVLDPDMADQVSEVYTWLIERGDLEQATKYLEREPEQIRRAYYRGVIEWERGNEQAARSHWRRVLNMDAERETADVASWMRAALRLGSPAQAIMVGTHQLEHHGGLPVEASTILGIAFAATGQIDDAEQWFEQVIARLRRSRPARNEIDARHWQLLTSVVPDLETIESLVPFFDTKAT